MKDLQKLKRKLKENNILHIKADKVNSMVLIEKQEYVNKTNNFINENKLTPIEKDPTNKFQQQVKQLVKTFPKLFLGNNNNNNMKMNKKHTHALNYKWINSNPSPPIMKTQRKHSYKTNRKLHE